eukprot:39010_1
MYPRYISNCHQMKYYPSHSRNEAIANAFPIIMASYPNHQRSFSIPIPLCMVNKNHHRRLSIAFAERFKPPNHRYPSAIQFRSVPPLTRAIHHTKSIATESIKESEKQSCTKSNAVHQKGQQTSTYSARKHNQRRNQMRSNASN